jgi:hypothetical protein
MGAATLLVAFGAWAASFSHVAKHTTSKSPQEAWRIMTSYSQTCERGCKYYRPNLVKVKKLGYKATSTSWYTWTHVASALKDGKYFTKVTIKRLPDGNFVSDNRQIDRSQKALIEKLEKASGLKHSPIFDGGGTKTVTKIVGGKTVLTQTLSVHTGAFVGLWEGRIREGLRKAAAATFKNIGD